MTAIHCPDCNGAMECDSRLLGTEVACPHCGKSLLLPSRPTRPSAPQQAPSHASSIGQSTPSILNRRRRKRNDPKQVIHYVLGGFAICVVLLLIAGGLAGDDEDGGREKKRKSRSSMHVNRKFAANPDSYQGKTVTLVKMRFASDVGLHAWKRIAVERGFVDGDRYLAVFEGSPGLQVGVSIPLDMRVPNVSQGDDVTVKFRCNDGSPKWGNDLISLKEK